MQRTERRVNRERFTGALVAGAVLLATAEEGCCFCMACSREGASGSRRLMRRFALRGACRSEDENLEACA